MNTWNTGVSTFTSYNLFGIFSQDTQICIHTIEKVERDNQNVY